MDNWFVSKDLVLYHQKAFEWRQCKSDAVRKWFVSENGIRWFELLRLQYFNPVQYTIIDLIHCLFLGISKWIVK